MIKMILKRLLAVPVMLLGVLLMVGGSYVNVFVKLPMALEHASGGSANAGIIFGTLLGTGTLIAISVGIIAFGYFLWKNDKE